MKSYCISQGRQRLSYVAHVTIVVEPNASYVVYEFLKC